MTTERMPEGMAPAHALFTFLLGRNAVCEIYGHRCTHTGCKHVEEMHLGDYKTDRKEIAVFSPKHIPKQRGDGVLWEVRPDGRSHTGEPYQVYVRPLTGNAYENWEGNCPNKCDTRVIEAFGKPQEDDDEKQEGK